MVVLGSGGKLGRLLRNVFVHPAIWTTRTDVDICDAGALRDALTGAQAVLCLAGVTNGRPDAMQMNSELALRTLDAARDVGAGRVFLFSSAAVYGRLPGLLSERGPTAPVSPYGQAKLAMEQAAVRHVHTNTVLRLGNVAGADAILGGWTPGFALDMLPDGTTPRRSYIGPMRLAHVLRDLCTAATLPPLLNVAAPGAVQMGALLAAAGLHWRPRPADGETIAKVTLDTETLERFTSFEPGDSTPEGIVVDWKKATESE